MNCVEPSSRQARHLQGFGFLIVHELEALSCRKPLVSPHRFPPQLLRRRNPIAASSFAVALFSGIGLLVSLVAIIVGVPGVGIDAVRRHLTRPSAAAVPRRQDVVDVSSHAAWRSVRGLQGARPAPFRDVRGRSGSVGEDEFGIVHADEAEHPAQIGFQMFADRGRRAGAVETAARDRDDHALVAGESLRALRGVSEGLARHQDAVDPGLELARMVKLYIGAPITTMSAARNSSSTA